MTLIPGMATQSLVCLTRAPIKYQDDREGLSRENAGRVPCELPRSEVGSTSYRQVDRDTRLSQHQISHLTLLNRSDVPHDHELVSILGNGKLDLFGILPLNGAQNLLNQHTRKQPRPIERSPLRWDEDEV